MSRVEQIRVVSNLCHFVSMNRVFVSCFELLNLIFTRQLKAGSRMKKPPHLQSCARFSTNSPPPPPSIERSKKKKKSTFLLDHYQRGIKYTWP